MTLIKRGESKTLHLETFIKRKMRQFALILLFAISSITGIFSQINTDRVLSIGRNALYFEDYILSIQYFNQVIRIKPYLADPYFFRAVAKINLEDYQGAEDDCTLALDRNPFMINAYECRGIARINLKKYKESIEDFEKGLEFDPDNKRFLLYKGAAYLQDKKYKEAVQSLTTAIDKHSQFVDAYINRGHAYLASEDTVASMSDFEKALQLDKFKSESYASRGLVYYSMGKYREALDDYNEAIRLKPERSGYYINRGIIRYNLNDLRGTMSDYDNVIQLDPNNVLAYYNRGLLRNEVGDKNRAIEDFDRVLEFDPEDYMALYNRALIEIDLGEANKAIRDINKVLKKYPDFYPLYYNRSQAKELMGDKKGAQLDFNQAYLMEREGWKKKKDEKEQKKGEEKNEKTREQSDKNIKNFNRLVIADKEDEERRFSYKSEIRGKVQNVNFNIDMESIFLLSYYIKDSELKRPEYYSQAIADLNGSGKLPAKLKIGNDEKQLSKEQIDEHFQSIEKYKKLDNISNDHVSLLCRAIDFDLIQDYQSAIEDYNRTIELNPNSWIAYFNRGNIRHKKMNYEKSLEDEVVIEENTHKAEAGSQLDYGLILNDYDKVTQLYPDFAFAWFNKGNILAEQKDYRNAIANYTKAIEKEKDFAEAYFNRGLTRLYLGEKDKCIADLSKAGELGIYVSYNIIKRIQQE